jgi:release factor glutamine methyltransferase
LALKEERPDLTVVGTDLSADALDVARANALRLGLEVQFVHGDLLAGVKADAVVCNPPYVKDDADLQPEIARHEPALALFAGPDGMDAYVRLAPGVSAAGASWVAFEVGEGQADAVAGLLTQAGYPQSQRRKDLAGIERVVVAWR